MYFRGLLIFTENYNTFLKATSANVRVLFYNF